MAYTTIDNPELYFQVKLYTGDGSTPSITLDGDTDMQPDMVWIKNRDAADSHCLFDAVRGATEVLHPDATTAETTDADTLTSFDSDGFALGDDDKVNTNTEKYVAWCWKESATSGFDIVGFTGNETNRTVSHSLSAVPHYMVVRTRNGAAGRNYSVYHHKNTSAPETDHIFWDSTQATEDDATIWQDTAPTSSVFSIGTNLGVNEDTKNIIAFLWTEKQGFSKFGGYTGNGNADGAFVYTGFRPAWVMIKRTDGTQGWLMWDNKRLGYNVDNNHLQTHGSDAEGTADTLDLLSNGFKIRESGAGTNGSGNTYIYFAFAEAPFVNSNGVPCNAR
jgi:hypothetical protein